VAAGNLPSSGFTRVPQYFSSSSGCDSAASSSDVSVMRSSFTSL
jgi:hypothetical protein